MHAGQRGQHPRSAHDSLRSLTWHWSTATWWRKIRISACPMFLAPPFAQGRSDEENIRQLGARSPAAKAAPAWGYRRGHTCLVLRRRRLHHLSVIGVNAAATP